MNVIVQETFDKAIQSLRDANAQLLATKQELADFRQEVSDAVEKAQTVREIHCQCSRKHVVSFDILNQFIILAPKPDPLVEVLEKMGWYIAPNGPTDAENFRAALDALGFEIREKNDD